MIIYSPGPAWKQGRTFYEQDLADHLQYLSNLQQSNVLLLAGPFKDNSGAEAVIQVKDETEAMLVVGRDPAVNRRVMDAQLKPWHLAFENTGRSTFGDNGRFNRGTGGGPAVTSSSRSGGG